MMRYVRGSTVLFTANTFLNTLGATIVPNTVTLSIEHPSGGTATTETELTMTEASGNWTAEWESSTSYPGTVYWSITAAGSDNVTKDGEFQLTANASNPDP